MIRAKIRIQADTGGEGEALRARGDGVRLSGRGGHSGRDATGDTLFRIGSISKMFVSLSVLMLQEQGQLALDDLVRSRIPDVAFENPWEQTDPVRIVHLLEHTTGFDDLTFRESVLTVAFAFLAVYGLWLAARVPAAATNRVARWHTILLAGANTLASAYLVWWGIIGLRSWI